MIKGIIWILLSSAIGHILECYLDASNENSMRAMFTAGEAVGMIGGIIIFNLRVKK